MGVGQWAEAVENLRRAEAKT